MKHPHLLSNDLAHYVAGTLDISARFGVEAHVEFCNQCRHELLAEALQRSVGKRIRRLLFEEEPALRPCAVS